MTLTITSLRIDHRVTPEGNLDNESVPYAICNVTFKITDDDHLYEASKKEAEDYRNVLTIDDPKRYEAWIMSPEGWDFRTRYDGYGRAYTHNDAPWQYIEKFDTFWFREWVADSSVTRRIFNELQYYKDHGRLPSVYRHCEEYIITAHLRTLGTYWD